MSRFLLACKALFLSFFVASAMPSVAADDVIKTVYHMSEGIPQASRAINNIRNHLAADPKAKIVVVTHGLGIDFLLDGDDLLCRVTVDNSCRVFDRRQAGGSRQFVKTFAPDFALARDVPADDLLVNACECQFALVG